MSDGRFIAGDFTRRQKNYKLTPEQRDELIKDFVAGVLDIDIATKYGVNRSNVWAFAKRRGIHRNTKSRCFESHGNRKNHINQHAFASITEESAYWIGFLMADGAIGERRISLKVAKQDEEHIEKFKLFLESNNKTYVSPPKVFPTYKVQAQHSVCINSRTIVNDLERFGVTKRKSLTAKAHESLVSNRHFWRGVIDGDGSIYEMTKHETKKYPGVSLVGSVDITNQFRTFALFHVPECRASVIQFKDRKLYQFQMIGTHALRMMNVLYKDATVFLDRKYKKSIDMIVKHQ